MGRFKSSLAGQVWKWDDQVTDADLVAVQKLRGGDCCESPLGDCCKTLLT